MRSNKPWWTPQFTIDAKAIAEGLREAAAAVEKGDTREAARKMTVMLRVVKEFEFQHACRVIISLVE